MVAAIVVMTIGAIAFARRGGPPDLRVSSRVTGTPTPTPERDGSAGGADRHPNFLGSGSWTMSSLPECFIERERVRGPLAAVRAKFPPAGARLPAGSVARAGDCTIVVRAHDLWISRGSDRLRVPPEAALYREGSRLTLVFVDGGRAEIRRY